MPLQHHLVLACCALALLSGVVMLRLLWVRVGEMKALGLDLQDVNTSQAVNQRLRQVQASDNFRNLFEMPVLFYALCAVLLAGNWTQPFDIWLAWAYVGLRGMHSAIQCSYNRVLDRFVVYIVSSLLLLGGWASLAWRVMDTPA